MNRFLFAGLLIVVAAIAGYLTFTLLLDEDHRVELAQGKPASMSSTNGGGAAVGNDGHTYGDNQFFHTGLDDKPWWMVDLGASYPVSGFEIHNRPDCCQDRAANLIIQVSSDGKSWTDVYANKGKVFGGEMSGEPLQVNIREVSARYVRIQLPARNYLHLAEVRVFGRPK